MDQFQAELRGNFVRFAEAWKAEQEAVFVAIGPRVDRYLESYMRLASLQAWRTQLLSAKVSKESLKFFVEAQNDALLSHVLARLGSWRPALQALRSCAENVLYCLYYMDHPVELSLWSVGKHRLGFSEAIAYFERHPALESARAPLNPLPALRREFGTLSKAVHGSAYSFRMTQDGKVNQLWSDGNEKIGAWSTRELHCVQAVNLLLLLIFKGELQGARLRGVRQAVSLAIAPTLHNAIKTELRITLFKRSERPA